MQNCAFAIYYEYSVEIHEVPVHNIFFKNAKFHIMYMLWMPTHALSFFFLIELHSGVTQNRDTNIVLSILSQCRFKINSAVFLWASLKWTYSSPLLILIGKKSGGVKWSSGNEHLHSPAPRRLRSSPYPDIKTS